MRLYANSDRQTARMHQAFEGLEPRSNRGSGVARPLLLHCKRPGAWGAMQEEITFRGGRDANLARRSATTSSSALLPFFGIFSSNVHPLISSAKKTPRRAKSFRPDPKTHTRASARNVYSADASLRSTAPRAVEPRLAVQAPPQLSGKVIPPADGLIFAVRRNPNP